MKVHCLFALAAGAALAQGKAAVPVLSSETATDHPLDLYGKYPSVETLLANSSHALENGLLFGRDPPAQPLSNHTRFLSRDRTVLAYVTPWNQPAGRDLTEWYRGKLDIVSPAWYTIKVRSEDEQEQDELFDGTSATGNEYQVLGDIPTDEDRAWLKRLQAPAKSDPKLKKPDLPALRVAPRFHLDGWTDKDFQTLRNDPLRWLSLIQSILRKIKDGPYDGLVLDSPANWAVPEFVEHLQKTCNSNNLTLIVVYPPLRIDESSEGARRTSELLAKAIRLAASKVEHVQIMTYDYAGTTGRSLDWDKLGVADDNPIRTDTEAERMRTYGPNQPLEFLQRNIELLTAPSLDDDMDAGEQIPLAGADSWTDLNGGGGGTSLSRKFLMGLPCYGYSYPLLFLSQKTAVGLPRVPASAPPRARANLTEAQAKAREAGARKEEGKFALLRGQGQAMTHGDMLQRFRAIRPLVSLDDESAEMRFDFIVPNPDDSMIKDGKREGIFHRAFMPSPYTMTRRREIIQENGVGAALWDIGQTAPAVLHAL